MSYVFLTKEDIPKIIAAIKKDEKYSTQIITNTISKLHPEVPFQKLSIDMSAFDTRYNTNKELLKKFPSLKKHVKFIEVLPKKIIESLTQYSLEPSELTTRDIENIDMAFSIMPETTKDLVVYRGLNMPEIYDGKRGQVKFLSGYSGLYEKFISVSVYEASARTFVREAYCCVFEITIPKGSKVIPMTPISYYYEYEILLPRNSTIEIKKIENKTIHAMFRKRK